MPAFIGDGPVSVYHSLWASLLMTFPWCGPILSVHAICDGKFGQHLYPAKFLHFMVWRKLPIANVSSCSQAHHTHQNLQRARCCTSNAGQLTFFFSPSFNRREVSARLEFHVGTGQSNCCDRQRISVATFRKAIMERNPPMRIRIIQGR